VAKIDQLFKVLQSKNGSDLHLSPENRPMIRVAGKLVPAVDQVITAPQYKALIYEILTKSQIAEFEENLELDFAYEIAELTARFRANVFLGRLGISAVFRLIPTTIKTAQQLGLPDVVTQMANHTKGLVLITGPTGSGKSTTLAAIIDHINRTRTEHILTVEDPIEFVHVSNKSLINQREVGSHTHAFNAALKAALREDPDIILIGEMRDLETIELAITAAETGHLVFGTLHTSSAAKTIDRIINVFPTSQQEQIRAMLAESLRGVVAQKLLPTIDNSRCAALEILTVTSAISNLIREGKTFQIPSTMQTGGKLGMQLMDSAIQVLLTENKISEETAYFNATNKSAFRTPVRAA